MRPRAVLEPPESAQELTKSAHGPTKTAQERRRAARDVPRGALESLLNRAEHPRRGEHPKMTLRTPKMIPFLHMGLLIGKIPTHGSLLMALLMALLMDLNNSF